LSFCYLILPFISNDEIHLNMPFLGKPPIMVLQTIKAGFVSAVLDAGYPIELAGGGYYNATALRSKVAEIQKQIPAGVCQGDCDSGGPSAECYGR
jgi:fatty acid synthase subunit alpha, fungi type